MAKPLVIVESKAKAKTIEGFLGRDQYVVIGAHFDHLGRDGTFVVLER